jgi:hypothetical protein
LAFNLLFLPFLGGYIFYTHFSLTAYGSVRAIGQHLVLRSAFCGLAMLVAARLLLTFEPFVRLHRDLVIGATLGAVPGLGISAGVSLFLYALSENRRSFWATIRARKGAVLIFVSVVLVCFSVVTAVASGSPRGWLPYSVAALVVIFIGTWLLCEWTAGDYVMALFRISWFLLIIVAAITDSAAFSAQIEQFWQRFSPYSDSATPALALLLGATLWYPLNLLIPFNIALARFHRLGFTDAMDRFLFEAAEKKTLLQLSLSDGKFYIGQIKSLAANPVAPNSFVRILPQVSGYRDKDTKELIFTTFYEEVYEDLIQQAGFSEATLDQFIKILPFSSVTSANEFDPDMYLKFQKETAQRATDVDTPQEEQSG